MTKLLVGLGAMALCLTSGVAYADPCGMVPPIYVGKNGATIKRTGPQKTYVFFKDGVEDIVLRPGYSGKVDEFGMLVALPSAPELRKVPDEIFAHVAAAVDPPEVVIDLRPQPDYRRYSRMEGVPSAPSPAGAAKREDVVTVLKQEAVGMYEVAVLEAGSPKALEKWMSEHKFKYPNGMDAVVGDYVKKNWCFVAVKTRIGEKGPTDPKPGMKNRPVTGKPAGAPFGGYIQGMGFRFRTREAVVPMRLATYNEADERRQIVYLLTEDPVKFSGVPKERVVRQVPGTRMRKNVTELLPLRILGGTLKDVPAGRIEALRVQRNPAPHNGRAKELFAGDLHAARTKELSLPHEEEEKELLNIGERLKLRGPEIDVLHTQELEKQRDALAEKALTDLDSMTFTIVDGEFPFEVMRDQDLVLAGYEMPAERNSQVGYDAVLLRSGVQKQGVRVEGDGTTEPTPAPAPASGKKKSWYDTLWGN